MECCNVGIMDEFQGQIE